VLAFWPRLRPAYVVQQRRQFGQKQIYVLCAGQDADVMPHAICVEPTVGSFFVHVKRLAYPRLDHAQDGLFLSRHLLPTMPRFSAEKSSQIVLDAQIDGDLLQTGFHLGPQWDASLGSAIGLLKLFFTMDIDPRRSLGKVASL
jgi:hypothetical protein